MAKGSLDARRRLQAHGPMLAMLLMAALAVAGHAAWFQQVDASPLPFLPEDRAEARAAVGAAFPNATAPTVRVIVVNEEGNVLTPEALTALAGLRNRVSSDPAVANHLAREQPVTSVLNVLGPHLTGAPGEWDSREVASALENVTRTSQGRADLGLHLSEDAVIQGANTQAPATILLIALADPGPGHEQALETAQARIAQLAAESSVPGATFVTDATPARTAAAGAPSAWLAPAAGIVVLLVGFVATRRSLGGLALPVMAWLGGAGVGLLAGSLAGHATPASLVVAHLAAALGTAGLLAMPERPDLVAVAGLLPLAALVGWAPAGTGELATVALGALAGGLAAGLVRRPSSQGDEAVVRLPDDVGKGVAITSALLLLLAAGSLAFLGPADQAAPGWEQAVPEGSHAGTAEAALEHHFPGPGPASAFAIAAWGPVAEPGFLSGLDEASGRLDRISLAASGQSIDSVLALAQDWATDDRASDPGDAYDEGFQELWRNATQGQDVPRQDVEEVLEALAKLDPEGTRAVLLLDDPERVEAGGAALITQQVALGDVVPKPGQAVQAAIQPLLASSERVEVTGPALEQAATEATLLDARAPVALAMLAGILAGGVLMSLDPRLAASQAIVRAAGAAGVAAVCLAALAWLQIPLRPTTLIAPALAASASLLLAPAPRRLPEEEDEVEASEGLRISSLVPLGGALVLAALVQAPGLGLASLSVAGSLALGGLVGGLILPTLPEPDPAQAAPGGLGPQVKHAHVACPVCDRSTATAAARCRRCQTWNLVEACAAHPEAVTNACRGCGADLDQPRFG